MGAIEGQAPSIGGFDPDNTVRVYQHLIKELPSLNRQLLLYILDLLAVFAAKSDINKMTTSNLAAIFQPGILSHPQHDMSPQDYRLSQDVLIFLIDNQDHFLIGMEGTAVDEGTVKHVESGPSTPQARTPTTPARNKSGIGRSASAASSAAAESIRKFGGVRRNVSTSSRQSRHSGAIPSPTTPSFVTTPTGSGVHRSNTLPSKRSPAIPGSRFNKTSDPPTPAPEEARSPLATAPPQAASPIERDAEQSQQPVQPAHSVQPVQVSHPVFAPERLDAVRPVPEHIEIPRSTSTNVPGAYPLPSPTIIPPSSADITPTAPAASAAQTLIPPVTQQIGRRSPQLTPTKEKSEFMEGSVDTEPSDEPTPAVRTFTQILSKVSPAGEEKKDGRKPNKLQKKHRVTSGITSAHSSTHSLTGTHTPADGPPSPLPQPSFPQYHASSSKEGFQAFNSDTVSSRNSGATLKPSMSPSASFRSHSTATEYSEAEHNEESQKEEKRSFWRSHKRGESKATPTASQTDLTGSVPGAGQSMSSFGSSSGWGGRRSLQYDSAQASEASMMYGSPDSKEHEKKGAFSWFREKRQEHKDREAKKQRAKSPPGSSSDLIAQQHLGMPTRHEGLAVRGKSMDIPRTLPAEDSKESSDVTPTGTSPDPRVSTSTQQTLIPAASSNPQGSPGSQAPQASQAPLAPPNVSDNPRI